MPESTLLKLLRDASPARRVIEHSGRDMGLADGEPFPFLAIIGQREMKLALLLSIINPTIGGVLLIGSRGTAKTTAVRSLIDLLPDVTRSLCPEGLNCTESAIEKGGLTAVCKSCATRFGYNEPLSKQEKMRLIELPLNAQLPDVVGGINERALAEKGKIRLEKGILAQADNHLLYIDEVNLLEDGVLDAILDASAQGYYMVRRGPNNLTYRSRFVLAGSMNPEEGVLRPQIMDRFGLRVIVRGLEDPEDRYLAYEQSLRHRQNSEQLSGEYAEATLDLGAEVQKAADLLPQVTISSKAKSLGLKIVAAAGIESGRAEIAMFEAARAYAASDGRTLVEPPDVQAVALFALRQRQSPKLATFFASQEEEDGKLNGLINSET
ncbi:MAG: magnesium chelatase subunit I [Cellvibrionaceae bacterium]|jgi:magnesium chelatase subunit I